MKNRIIALVLSVLMCFAVVGCGAKDGDTATTAGTTAGTTAAATEGTEGTEATEGTDAATEGTEGEDGEGDESTVTPMLYKVTDSDGDVIWLFGSIHFGREDFYPLPDYVMDAFEGSDSLAVEFDMIAFTEDIEAQTEAITPMIYTDGTTTKDHLPEDIYNAAVELLTEVGAYDPMLEYYSPAMWQSAIESLILSGLDAEASLGVDMYVLTLAKENDMKISDIESAKEQYAMLAGFSDETQAMLLEAAIEAYKAGPEEANEEFSKLTDAWAEGDTEVFINAQKTETEGLTEEEIALLAEYDSAIMAERNIGMADFAEDALEAGEEVFICVGAAHVPGEDGISGILEEKGYTVELVK